MSKVQLSLQQSHRHQNMKNRGVNEMTPEKLRFKAICNHFIVKFEHNGNNFIEVEAVDEGVEHDDVVGEVVLEKLPEDVECKSDLVDVAKAIDEDGESDVAGAV
ncbi:hypothetical protein D0Y65_037618 [Glycine soja]|uniref:Uncharacterized protein n=1 Tax=Glycine soja TaxID=3848 RepID=A0A445H149_GLYSO|nr:hypothetical protein D0Y65_037618 [Glycine soja]